MTKRQAEKIAEKYLKYYLVTATAKSSNHGITIAPLEYLYWKVDNIKIEYEIIEFTDRHHLEIQENLKVFLSHNKQRLAGTILKISKFSRFKGHKLEFNCIPKVPNKYFGIEGYRNFVKDMTQI